MSENRYNKKSKTLTFEEMKKLYDENKITFEEFKKGIYEIQMEELNRTMSLLTDDIRDYLGGVGMFDYQTTDEMVEYHKMSGLKDLTDEEINTLGFGLLKYFCATKEFRDACVKDNEIEKYERNDLGFAIRDAIRTKFGDKYDFHLEKRSISENKFRLLREYSLGLLRNGIKDFHKEVILREVKKMESLGNNWGEYKVKEEIPLIMKEVIKREKERLEKIK